MEFQKLWFITIQVLFWSSAPNKFVAFPNILFWTVLIYPELLTGEPRTSLKMPQEVNFLFPACYKKTKEIYQEMKKKIRQDFKKKVPLCNIWSEVPTTFI